MAIKDKYYTISEASERLQVTRQTVSRWIKEGKFTTEKVGRETLIEKRRVWEHKDMARVESIRKSVHNIIMDAVEKKYKMGEEIVSFGIRSTHSIVGPITFSITLESPEFVFEMRKRGGPRVYKFVEIDKIIISCKDEYTYSMSVDINEICTEEVEDVLLIDRDVRNDKEKGNIPE